MAGSWWWYPAPRDGETVPDHPPVYLGEAINEAIITPPIDRTPTTSDMHTDLHDAMQRLAQPTAPEDLTFTFTTDTSGFDTAVRSAHLATLHLALALGLRFTAVCPGCRRDIHWLDYDLAAESCRVCLEVIPRLQLTMRSAHVDWAPISPELHWRTP